MKQQKLSLIDTKLILQQILQICEFLHRKNIIYHNIKLKNILIKLRALKIFIKVSDFDLLEKECNLKTFCDIAEYVAPEIDKKEYINTVDIWAVEALKKDLISKLSYYSLKEQKLFLKKNEITKSEYKTVNQLMNLMSQMQKMKLRN